jgi:hypothetical protein
MGCLAVAVEPEARQNQSVDLGHTLTSLISLNIVSTCIYIFYDI